VGQEQENVISSASGTMATRLRSGVCDRRWDPVGEEVGDGLGVAGQAVGESVPLVVGQFGQEQDGLVGGPLRGDGGGQAAGLCVDLGDGAVAVEVEALAVGA
jgi:hypothetical protein